MSAVLVPCPECSRHLRATERACPFCGAALAASWTARAAGTPPDVGGRTSRSMLLAVAAALLAPACAGSQQPATAAVPAATTAREAPSDAGTPTLAALEGDASASGAAPAPGPPPAPPAPQPAPDHGGVVAIYGAPTTVITGVRFGSGEARLSDPSRQLLDEVARVIHDHPELRRVAVQGHRDDSPRERGARGLALHRAEVVRDYLVAHGVDAARLETRSLDATNPVAPNGTEDGRARNRRVDFLVLEGAP